MNNNLLRLRNLADANPFVGARTHTILRLQVIAQNLAAMPAITVQNLRSSAEAFVLLAKPSMPSASNRIADKVTRSRFRELMIDLVDHDALADLCSGQTSPECIQSQKGE